MARAIGWADCCSIAADRASSSLLSNESQDITSVSRNSPLVIVPVLSKAMALNWPRFSRWMPPLTRTPFRAAWATPAMITAGVPKANAQGEAATSKTIARLNDSLKGTPNRGGIRITSRSTINTTGTNQRINRSAVSCVGDFPAWAFSTICEILARVLSFARRVTRISSAPSPLSEPANTLSPTDLSTGSDSPVTGAWFTLEVPLMIRPSTGIRVPGRTITKSSRCSASTGFSIGLPSCLTSAVFGARFARARIAPRARSSIRSSKA